MLLTAKGVVWRDLREQILIGFAFLLGIGSIYLAVVMNKSMGRALPFAVSIFFIFFGGLRNYLIRRRLKRAVLLVRPWPVRLGSEVELKFRATLRSRSPIRAFKAQLECAEEVTIGSGKYQKHNYATLFGVDLPSSDARCEDGKVTAEWKASVPEGLPPSLDVRDNAVRWLVNATIDTEGIDVPAKVEFTVIPEIAS
jgi:hypothetical protein